MAHTGTCGRVVALASFKPCHITRSQQSARDDEPGAKSTTAEVHLHPIRNKRYRISVQMLVAGRSYLPSVGNVELTRLNRRRLENHPS